MRTYSDYARQSDPEANPHFRRRWHDDSHRAQPVPPEVKLITLPDAPNSDGEPRAGLVILPEPHAISRRPIFRVFGTVAAAVAAKRALEGGR